MTGVVGLAGLFVLRSDAPLLWDGLTGRAVPVVALSVVAGVAAVVFLARRQYVPARLASALAVTTILVGWAVAQYPYILVPEVTIEEAATGRATLQAMLVALAGGAVFLVPALVYLYVLFQRSATGARAGPGGACCGLPWPGPLTSVRREGVPRRPRRATWACPPTAARRGVTMPMNRPPGPPPSGSPRAYGRDAGRYDARTSRFEAYRRRVIDLLPLSPRRRRGRRRLRDRAVLRAAGRPGRSGGDRGRGGAGTPEMRALAAERVADARWTNVVLDRLARGGRAVCRPLDHALFCAVHDVLQSAAALDHVLAHVRDGGGVAATGGKWAPAWAVAVNAAVLALHAPFVRNFAGFHRPWALLAERVPGLAVRGGRAGRRLPGLGARAPRPGLTSTIRFRTAGTRRPRRAPTR